MSRQEPTRQANAVSVSGVPLRTVGVITSYGEIARRSDPATSGNRREKSFAAPTFVGAAMRKFQGQFPKLWAARLERCVSQHVFGPTRTGSPTTASLDTSQVGTSIGDSTAYREHAFAHTASVSHRGSTTKEPNMITSSVRAYVLLSGVQ